MTKLFDKLREMNEKQSLLFMRIFGIISGIITFGAIVILGRARSTDALLWFLSIGLFALVFLFRRRLGKETEWNLRPLNIAMAIGIGIAMAAWITYGAISGELFA